jgi:hypothetical protein
MAAAPAAPGWRIALDYETLGQLAVNLRGLNTQITNALSPSGGTPQASAAGDAHPPFDGVYNFIVELVNFCAAYTDPLSQTGDLLVSMAALLDNAVTGFSQADLGLAVQVATAAAVSQAQSSPGHYGSVTLPGGVTATATVDANGNVISSTGTVSTPGGLYYSDSFNRQPGANGSYSTTDTVTQIIDGLPTATSHVTDSYAPNGNHLASVAVDPQGGTTTTTWTYFPDNGVSAMATSGPQGSSTTTYDAYGGSTTVATDAQGGTTTTEISGGPAYGRGTKTVLASNGSITISDWNAGSNQWDQVSYTAPRKPVGHR